MRIACGASGGMISVSPACSAMHARPRRAPRPHPPGRARSPGAVRPSGGRKWSGPPRPTSTVAVGRLGGHAAPRRSRCPQSSTGRTGTSAARITCACPGTWFGEPEQVGAVEIELLNDARERHEARAREPALDLAHVRGRQLALARERAQRDAAGLAAAADEGTDVRGAVAVGGCCGGVRGHQRLVSLANGLAPRGGQPARRIRRLPDGSASAAPDASSTVGTSASATAAST